MAQATNTDYLANAANAPRLVGTDPRPAIMPSVRDTAPPGFSQPMFDAAALYPQVAQAAQKIAPAAGAVRGFNPLTAALMGPAQSFAQPQAAQTAPTSRETPTIIRAGHVTPGTDASGMPTSMTMSQVAALAKMFPPTVKPMSATDMLLGQYVDGLKEAYANRVKYGTPKPGSPQAQHEWMLQMTNSLIARHMNPLMDMYTANNSFGTPEGN